MNQYSRVLFFLIAISSCLLTAHQRSESHSKWVIVHGEERTIVNTVLTVKFSVLSRMNWQPQIKIGKQVFTKYGPNIIDNLHKKKFEIFLDLKFHDIPTTVYKACLEAFNLGVRYDFP